MSNATLKKIAASLKNNSFYSPNIAMVSYTKDYDAYLEDSIRRSYSQIRRGSQYEDERVNYNSSMYRDNSQQIKEQKRRVMAQLRKEINEIAQKIATIRNDLNPGVITNEEFEFEKVLLVEALEAFFDKATGGEQVEPPVGHNQPPLLDVKTS